MKRLLFTFAFSILFSYRSKESIDAVVRVSVQNHVAKVDTVRREKYSPPIKYEKYSADTFTGKRASINYSSNKAARKFRSAMNWSIDESGINFAGHENFARRGCGTSCINGAITDLKTGNVYDLPRASLDYAFQNNSRLLVINPPDNSGYYDYCGYCEPELRVWNENI